MSEHVGAPPHEREITASSLMGRLARTNGDWSQSIAGLLLAQCEVAPAQGAALLSVEASGARPLVVVPATAERTAPSWVERATARAGEVVTSGASRCLPLHADDDPDDDDIDRMLLIPLGTRDGRGAVAAYRLDPDGPLDRRRERLELTVSLLSLLELRHAAEARRADLERMRSALEVLAAVNEHARFKPAAFAFTSELAARWNAERTAVGVLKGRAVHAVAISHTERFDRRMRLVQDIESAMEECHDQDVEILHPAPAGATFVHRAAGELSLRHGPTSIVVLPLRREGEPAGAVVVERPLDAPLDAGAVETLRLAVDLCAPRLLDLHRTDKWLGARLADDARAGLAHLVGPRHTWIKATAASILLFLLAILVLRGPDRVDASFEIAATQRRVVPAPFASRLRSVGVEPGDTVIAGETILATLDTAERQLRLAAARAERARHGRESDLAMRDGRTADVQIALAELDRVDAEIALLEHDIARASLVAPIDGTVLAGDLRRRIGAPVEIGDVLFEIAPLESLRAELLVPEDRIADLVARDDAPPRRGTLASVAHPGDYLPFEVESINPVAGVVDQRNVFLVRARLLEARPWLRPGMRGVAKVTVGRRRYASLWTRPFVSWVRMRLWI